MRSTYRAPAESTSRITCPRQPRIVASASGPSTPPKFPPQGSFSKARSIESVQSDHRRGTITTIESVAVPLLGPRNGDYRSVGDYPTPSVEDQDTGGQPAVYAPSYRNGSDTTSSSNQFVANNRDVTPVLSTLDVLAPATAVNGQCLLVADGGSQSSSSSSNPSLEAAVAGSWGSQEAPSSSNPAVAAALLDTTPRPSGPPEPIDSPPSTSAPEPPSTPRGKRRRRFLPPFLCTKPLPADASGPLPSAPDSTQLMSQIMEATSWHTLHTLFHTCRPAFSHHHTSALLRTLLHFQHAPTFPRSPRLHRQAFRKLVEHALLHATTLAAHHSCISASTTLYLAARFHLHYRHPTLPVQLQHVPALTTHLLTCTTRLLSTPSPYIITPSTGDLPLLLWALTKMKHHPPSSFLHPFFTATTPTLQSLNPTQHALVIYSLGTSRIRPPPAWRSAYLEAVAPAFPRMKALEISIVGWGTARLGLAPDDAWLAAFSEAALQLLRPAKEPCAWARVLLALGQFRWRPDRQWVEVFHDCTRDLFQSFRPFELAMILHGMARAGIPPDPSWLDEFFELSQQEFRRYSLSNLACICWSLRVLREEPPREWLQRLVWTLSIRKWDYTSYSEARQLVVALQHFKALGMHRFRPDVLLVLRSKPRRFHWFLRQVVKHVTQQREAALAPRAQRSSRRPPVAAPLPDFLMPALEAAAARQRSLAERRAASAAGSASSSARGALQPVQMPRVTLMQQLVPSPASSGGGGSISKQGPQRPPDGRSRSAGSSRGDAAVRLAGKGGGLGGAGGSTAGVGQSGADAGVLGKAAGAGQGSDAAMSYTAPVQKLQPQSSAGGVQLVGPPSRRVQRAQDTVAEDSAAEGAPAELGAKQEDSHDGGD